MANKYIIAVGGTGVKCLESFIHLCAMGMVATNDNIKLIIVDPDSSNGNIGRFSNLFSTYNSYQNLLKESSQMNFKGFSVDFEGGMDAKKEDLSAQDITWNPAGDLSSTLEEYINDQKDGQELNAQQRLLVNALFEKDERNEHLAQGFRGHPSIGALFISSKFDLKQGFWQKYFGEGSNFQTQIQNQKETRVFVVGSIFGGTGAAGVPTIARILKDEYARAVEQRYLKIGIGMMLPYFFFECPNPSKRDRLRAESKELISNTKFALNYYMNSGILKDLTDIFLIGSEPFLIDAEKYSEGGSNQKNDAFPPEVVCALSMYDFFHHDYSGVNNISIVPRCEDTDNVVMEWEEFPDGTNGQMFNKTLYSTLQYMLYWNEIFRPTINKIRSGAETGKVYNWYEEFLGDYPNERFESDMRTVWDYHNLFIAWTEQCFGKTDMLNTELINDMRKRDVWKYGRQETLLFKGARTSKIHSNTVIRDMHHKKKDSKDNGLASFLKNLNASTRIGG